MSDLDLESCKEDLRPYKFNSHQFSKNRDLVGFNN